MRILLLDTETNGLPKNHLAPISDWATYPAILQLSWGIYEIEGRGLRTVATRDIGLALHPSIPWDTGAAAIHGLSEREARSGTPAAAALSELATALREVDCAMAHNLLFDKRVIRAAGYAEAARDPAHAALKALWPPGLAEVCTMTATRGLLRIPLPSAPESGRWKAPKLNEVYTWIYGHVYDMSGAVLHTARSDTHCLERCVAGLLRRGIMIVCDGKVVISSLSLPSSAS
jgi:hypothetical protein